MAKWMIYGANGYTGELVAREAKRRGLSPVLAGRSASVEKLARELDLECRRFDLSATSFPMNDLDMVLHCAGPFSQTARPMMEACLSTKTSYADITGEIDIFQMFFENHRRFEDAGILAVPGVGFDVIPTDCLAAQLAQAVEKPKRLTLAFASNGGISRGTLKTSVEGMKKGTCRRQNGALVWESPGVGCDISFSFGKKWCLQIPWGDVVTAFQSTKCPNIDVYIPFSRSMARLSGLIHRSLNLPVVETLSKKAIGRLVHGPDEDDRARGRVTVYGRIEGEDGKVWSKEIETPEGYNFTVAAALASVKAILERDIRPGVKTPSQAFGADFVFRIAGVKEVVSLSQEETRH